MDQCIQANVPTSHAQGCFKSGVEWWNSNNKIQDVTVSASGHLHDSEGKPPVLNTIYAYHPDKSQAGLIVLATEFHNDVVGEQITDLVSYIRGSVRTKELKISVFSQKQVGIGVAAPLGGGEAKFSASRSHAVEALYEDAELVENTRPLFWISEFPEIVSLLKGQPKGRIRRVVSVDTSFGLDVALAKRVGIDSNWIGRQCFEVEAIFV